MKWGFLSVQIIVISSFGCRETSVHLVRDFFHLIYNNIGRKHPVKSVFELIAIQWCAVKVCNHVTCMNTCIGSTCPYNINILAYDGGETAFYLSLNANSVWLNLPSVVACTIICQVNKVSQNCKLFSHKEFHHSSC